MSPRAPTSVSNLQPSPMPLDHLLDKNTPAPTPTDQHDSKSMTASPYIHPAPLSVEQPTLMEGTTTILSSGANERPSSVGQCTSIIPPNMQRQTPPIQPQYGTITVKKFELQSNYINLANKYSQSLAPLSTSAEMGIKVEPGIVPPVYRSNYFNTSMTNSVPNSLPNKLKRTLPTQPFDFFGNTATTMQEFWKMFKPPKITVKDIESIANEDCLKLEALYDFALQDAW